MLQLRPNCECCNTDLPPDSTDARICSFECTFCVSCNDTVLHRVCPNCGGELVARPRRPAAKLLSNPASKQRVLKPLGCRSEGAPVAAGADDGHTLHELPDQRPAWRYVYAWEFRVPAGREQAFLSAYGPSGAWAQLFRKSAGYIETVLLQNQADPGRFLTIDRWVNQSAHEAFLADNRSKYEALDLACRSLTQHEAKLGCYWERTHEDT